MNRPEDYYYRAWRVSKILYWMTGYLFRYENILCRTMECMEETLQKTAAAGDDSDVQPKTAAREPLVRIYRLDDDRTSGALVSRWLRTP